MLSAFYRNPFKAAALALFLGAAAASLTQNQAAVAFLDYLCTTSPAVADMQLRGTLSVATLPDVSPVQLAGASAKPTAIPAHPVRTVLLLVHVLGLVFGLGSTILLDGLLVRNLRSRPLERQTTDLIHFGSQFVLAGLIMLWVSGAGFLAFYLQAAPQALENPKLWAKIAIVIALSLNGLQIHRSILPQLANKTGRPLLSGLSTAQKSQFAFASSISVTGWAFAFLFGMVKELNYLAPFWAYIGGYLVVQGIAYFGIRAFISEANPPIPAHRMKAACA